MADKNKRLAQLIAGLGGASAGPSAPNFAPLPPFTPPGASAGMMPWRGLPQQAPEQPPLVTAQAQAPQPASMPQPQAALPPLDVPPAMPPMPPPQQIGPQAGIDPNDPRYLPEQWKGAFNPGWQG
jgi:hypothetical protein